MKINRKLAHITSENLSAVRADLLRLSQDKDLQAIGWTRDKLSQLQEVMLMVLQNFNDLPGHAADFKIIFTKQQTKEKACLTIVLDPRKLFVHLMLEPEKVLAETPTATARELIDLWLGLPGPNLSNVRLSRRSLLSDPVFLKGAVKVLRRFFTDGERIKEKELADIFIDLAGKLVSKFERRKLAFQLFSPHLPPRQGIEIEIERALVEFEKIFAGPLIEKENAGTIWVIGYLAMYSALARYSGNLDLAAKCRDFLTGSGGRAMSQYQLLKLGYAQDIGLQIKPVNMEERINLITEDFFRLLNLFSNLFLPAPNITLPSFTHLSPRLLS